MTSIGRTIRVGALAFAVVASAPAVRWTLLAQGPEPVKNARLATISPSDLKAWLTYISSDELEGRQVFSEGYGIAAQYVADHLRQWRVKPLGDDGTYFQIVKLRSYRVI